MNQETLNEILRKHKLWLDTKGVEGERANLYRANLRAACLYKVNLQGANLSKANLYGANLYGANLKAEYLEGANLREAYLAGANLREAYLAGANLRGANLEVANLSKANLQGACLQGADLKGANLEGANLVFTEIISGTLGKHFYFYHEGYLKIGCEGMSIDDWVKCYKKIGKENNYSEREIKNHKNLIEFLKFKVKM